MNDEGAIAKITLTVKQKGRRTKYKANKIIIFPSPTCDADSADSNHLPISRSRIFWKRPCHINPIIVAHPQHAFIGRPTRCVCRVERAPEVARSSTPPRRQGRRGSTRNSFVPTPRPRRRVMAKPCSRRGVEVEEACNRYRSAAFSEKLFRDETLRWS